MIFRLPYQRRAAIPDGRGAGPRFGFLGGLRAYRLNLFLAREGAGYFASDTALFMGLMNRRPLCLVHRGSSTRLARIAA